MILTIPRSWIRFDDATFLVLCKPKNQSAALSRMIEFIKIQSKELHHIDNRDVPPWRNDDLRRLLDQNNKSQFIVIDKKLSSHTVAIATIALETGYDTFLVFSNAEELSDIAARRIQLSGIRLFTVGQFADQCELAVE